MSIKNWMKIETETTYGEPRVILYNGDVYDSDEKLNPAVQLADMYLNMAMPSKETGKCDVIVLDKLTADFWLNLVNEQKEKTFKQGSKETAEKIIDLIKAFCPDKKFVEVITRIIAERFGFEIKG